MALTISDQEPDDTLTPFPPTTGPQYQQDYTDQRASKYALLLPDQNQTSIANQISQGNQGTWDNLLKVRSDIQSAQVRQAAVSDLAVQTGGNPTPEQSQLAQGLVDDSRHSAEPSVIMDQKYAETFTNYVSSVTDNVAFPKAAENPEAAHQDLDVAQAAQTRILSAQDVLGQINKRYEDEGYFDTGVGFLKSVIPGYDWYKTQNAVEGTNGSILPGNNIQDQISYLYNLPPAEFKEKLSATVEELAKSDVRLAQGFAQAVMSYTTNDQSVRNFNDLSNVVLSADIGVGVAKGAVKGGGLLAGMVKAGKAVARDPQDIPGMAADAGLIKQAALSKVVQDTIAGDVTGLTKALNNPKEIETQLTSIYAPQRIWEGDTGRLDAAAQGRIRQTIQRSADLVKDFFGQGQLVDRLEPSQVAASASEAFDRISDVFTNVNHSIVDAWPTQKFVVPASEDKITNTAQAVVRFGKRDGSMFPSEAAAKQFGEKYIGIKTSDYSVGQNGVGGFFLEIKKPLTDVGNFRSLEIPTELKAPDSFSAQFLRGGKSADYLVDQGNVAARGRVVHTQEFLAKYMQKLTEPFAGKGKEWKSEMDNVFSSNRVNRQYYSTVNEFENNFHRINGKLPDEDQISAYFSYVNLNDLDYLVRDADIVKQYQRLGGENISMKVTDAENNPVNITFKGKVIETGLPYGTSKTPFRIKVLQAGKEVMNRYSPVLSENDWKLVKDLTENQGYKTVFNDEDKAYYVMKDFKRDNIGLGTLNRVEGGHNEYRYSHYIKQGEVKVDADGFADYRGDKSLYVTTTERQAKEIAGYFEQARLKVLNGAKDAKQFIDDHLPIGYGEFIKKVKTGDIDLHSPIQATVKGQRVDTSVLRKAYGEGKFNDTINSEHNLFGDVGGRYTTERADRPLDVLTSENDKVVVRNDIEPMLKPIETLIGSTRDMLNVRVLHDYKLKSSQDWAQQFGHLVDDDYNKVVNNPLYYMQRGLFKTDADPQKVTIAKNVGNSVKSLYGYRDPVEQGFQTWKEKALSSVYDLAGETGRRWADDHLIPGPGDVATFLRSSAFKMKLGFFNPKQLFLQASQAVNAIAISPIAGLSGVRALPLLRMALETEDKQVIAGMAKKFAKVSGWDKDDFIAMQDSMKQSGFATVAHDLAYLDDFKAKTVSDKNVAKKIWSYNTGFFNEGEKAARQIAYATAWREWKNLNPSAAVDRFAQSKILSRAKDMTGNMTRDSQAAWQKGNWSVATQFFGYQARFMEQMWDGGLLSNGRKLSLPEKARLMTAMSAMYGAPTLVSATTAFPMRDYIKDWMNAEGVPHDSFIADSALDGIVPSMINAMLGSTADVSSSYGPNGLPQLRHLFDDNTSWVDLFGGASGSILADTVGSTVPFIKSAIDVFNPDVDSTFPVLMKDLVEPFKNISSVKSASDLFEAINTHRYLSKSGAYVTDESTGESLTQAIFGVSPERISTAYSQVAAMKADKAQQAAYQKEVEDNTYKGMTAANQGDTDSAKAYFSRAHSAVIRSGMSLKDELAARKRAIQRSPMTEGVQKTFGDLQTKRQNDKAAVDDAHNENVQKNMEQ